MRHLLVNPKYKELWGKSYTKEFRHLAQGIPGVSKGTNTILSIRCKDISHNRKCDITYAQVCVNYLPEKEDPNHTRVTVGGNLLHYPGNCSTPTVGMITVKLHLNSIISTKNARYCTIDLKGFYLNTPMDQPEYMRIKISNLPPNFVKAYNFNDLATDEGTIYVKIQKGMYNLPQAGILAQNLLKLRLNQHGYQQYNITPGLWKHDWQPLLFTLCVDDFDINYVGREHANHLTKCSRNNTNVPLTGTKNATLAQTWTGTITAAGSTSQCSTMSPRPSHVSNTEHRANRSINHTHTPSPTTEQRCSIWKTWTH